MRINKLDAWACIYTFLLVLVSVYTNSINVAFWGILLFMALPFIYCPEYYIAICYLMATIAYYFFGAYEGVFSIYTIMIIIIAVRALIYKPAIHLNTISFFAILSLCILATVSFKLSPFNYTNGFFKVIYIWIVTFIVGNIYSIDIKKIVSFLPMLAGTMILGYFVSIVLAGGYIDGRLTIANSVNTNSFGMSCAQLATIMVTSCVLVDRNRRIKVALSLLIVFLAFMSGSRGALLAFVASSIFVYFIDAKRYGKLPIKLLKLVFILGVIVAIASPIIATMNMDLSRFSIKKIVETGGSNRTLIYGAIIEYLLTSGRWKFGYGPGHDNSGKMVYKLIGFKYAHTHNSLLESFAELGIGGFVLTLSVFIRSSYNILKISRIYEETLILFGMFLCIFIHGMTESYFCNMSLWLLLAICRSSTRKSLEGRIE